MKTENKELYLLAKKLGFSHSGSSLYELRDWLREKHAIHVEVGSIWNESGNKVEEYFFSVSAPINVYYTEPVYQSRAGSSHKEILILGISEGLSWLKNYNTQKHLKVPDDALVVAYLKGYGDKYCEAKKLSYKTNIEKFAYFKGKQGDYIEEGLTEDDILALIKNDDCQIEPIKLKE